MLSFNAKNNITFVDYLFSHLREFYKPVEYLQNSRKAYKNYFHVIYNQRRKNYPFKAILRSGNTLSIENISQLRITRRALENECDFQNDILIIKKKGLPEVKFYDWKDNGDIISVFFEDEYSSLPVRNKEVIDIGSNIADSSIYFALCGAKKVIAVEPAPKSYQSAKKNVELNGLSNKIDLINAGCSDKEGSISVGAAKSGIIYSLENDQEEEVEVPLTTLNEILKGMKTRDCILKMDCEGCEYETILSASKETLSNFSHLQIEYHFGYKNLKNKLENCGFDVEVTKPRIGKRLFQESKKTFYGYIFAKRKL